VVQEWASGEVQHWEVAIRFYLGTRPGGRYSDWIGIDPSDRLDLKVGHMRQHQLPMSLTPEGQAALAELGIASCRRACLLKGRLFYPHDASIETWQPQDACPQHGHGWWLPMQDFPHRFTDPDERWALLPREYRLATLTSDVSIGDVMSAAELLEHLPAGFDNCPIAVVGRRDGLETTRGFLVPPGWPGTYSSAPKESP